MSTISNRRSDNVADACVLWYKMLAKKREEKEVWKKKRKRKLVASVTNNMKEFGWRLFTNLFFLA